MTCLSIEKEGSLATVTLNRGVTNPISLDLVEALTRALDEVGADRDLRGLVLTSDSEKFFSIGFDLPELVALDREGFSRFFHAFNRLCADLYTFPKPTVAALKGHAVAGGCVLALACDYRFIADGKTLMGLNEIKLGVPVPYPAFCMLTALTGDRAARTIVDRGTFFEPETLLSLGLVDEIHPSAALAAAAGERARTLGDAPGDAFALMKGYRTGPVAERIEKRRDETEGEFLDCWFSEAAQETLRAALEKF